MGGGIVTLKVRPAGVAIDAAAGIRARGGGLSFDRPADPAVAVSPWVQRFAHLVPPRSPVLDVACGHGRHLRYFRARGHPVLGVDLDVSALGDLSHDAGVEIVRADLEQGAWPFAGRRFGAVVVTNYLHRPLLPLLAAAVAPEGALIYEAFSRGNERVGRPRNPDFLLAPGELYEAVAPLLQVVAYEQGLERQPRTAVRQRLVAVNRVEAALLA